MALSLFLGTFVVALVWFFVLSVAVVGALRLMEFRTTSFRKITVRVAVRYVVAALLAALTAVYLYGNEPLPGQEAMWMSLLVSVLLWSVLLVLLDLFALGDA